MVPTIAERPAAYRPIGRRLLIGVVVLACPLLSGCQLGGRYATSQPAVPTEGSAELVRYISDASFVTAEPAYRAAYALANGDAYEGSFEELTEKLAADGLIGKDWNFAANRYLDRGSIAFMICRACKIRSGVNWTLTGLGRYAWRELQYKGIAGDGSEFGMMSGGEFVGLLLRAEDYMRQTRKQDVQPVELGKRP